MKQKVKVGDFIVFSQRHWLGGTLDKLEANKSYLITFVGTCYCIRVNTRLVYVSPYDKNIKQIIPGGKLARILYA